VRPREKQAEDFRTGSPSQGGWEESGLKKNIQEVEMGTVALAQKRYGRCRQDEGQLKAMKRVTVNQNEPENPPRQSPAPARN
jgi:hypothetical protein